MAELMKQESIDKIQKSLQSAQYWCDTQDLPKRYCRNIKLLLDERDELLNRLAQVTEMNKRNSPDMGDM